MSPPAAGAGPAPSPRSLRDLPLKLRQSRRRRDGERAGEGGRRDGAAGGDKAQAAGLGQTGRGAGAGVTPPRGAAPFATAAVVPGDWPVCSARGPPGPSLPQQPARPVGEATVPRG